MTFSSLVQFAGNIGMLAREFGGFLSGVYIFRFLKWLYLKIKKFLFWIIGRQPSSKEQFEEMFQNAVNETQSQQNGQNGAQNQNGSSTNKGNVYNWISIGFYCFGILYVIQWIWTSIRNELDQKKKMEQQQQLQQQQMMNPMNPYQQNLAYAQQNPYGYYQPNMYGPQPPMIQQPVQQTQAQSQTQQQANTDNNNKNANESNDNNGNSESLLSKPKELSG